MKFPGPLSDVSEFAQSGLSSGLATHPRRQKDNRHKSRLRDDALGFSGKYPS